MIPEVRQNHAFRAASSEKPRDGLFQQPAQRSTGLCAISTLLGVLVLADSVFAAEQIIFADVHVVPMTAERVLRGQDVSVEGGRITRIAPADGSSRPQGAVVIDGRGRYLMPGLAEMHAHLPGPDRKQYTEDVLLLYVAHGATTIRGMLGHPWHLELRQALADNELLGPRLFTAGPSLNGNSVPDTAAAVRSVREQRLAGYDFLKLHPGLTRAVFDAIADTARELGMPFEGHVSEAVGVEHALARGQRAIDHLDGYMQLLVDPQCMRHPRAAGFFGIGLLDCVDEHRIPQAVRLTGAAGTAMVPTEILLERWARPPTAAELRAQSETRYLPPSVIARWLSAREEFLGLQTLDDGHARRFIAIRRQLLDALHEAGVPILLGSDAPQIFNVPGHSLRGELESYVAAGLTPFEALYTGTAAPATYFGHAQDFGTVEVGKAADLLLLTANPLEDVAAVAAIEGVMLRGRWLSREELDRRLGELEHRMQGPPDAVQ